MTPPVLASQASTPQAIANPQIVEPRIAESRTAELRTAESIESKPQMQPKVVRPGEGRMLRAFGEIREIITAEDTNGQVFVGYAEAEPGFGPPPHVHTQEDEIFIIEQGQFEFRIGGEVLQAGPGSVVFAPRNIPHAPRVIGHEPAKGYILSVPGSFGQYFARCADEFAGGAPDMAVIDRINEEHGIIFLTPEESTTYHLVEEATARPKVVRPDEGVRVGFPGERARAILLPEDNNEQFVLSELEVDQNWGPPPHVHTREDEVFIVQSGRIEYWIGGDRIEAGPGTVVFAPRNIPHCFRGLSEEPARMFVMVTPSGFEQFFVRYAELRSAAEVDLPQVAALAAEYGVFFLPPQEN